MQFLKQADKIIIENNQINGVKLSDDTVLIADYYISALPSHLLMKLLPDDFLTNDPALSLIKNIQNTPIIGIHLWFDRMITKIPFAALPGLSIQWFFKKDHDIQDDNAHLMSCVISASEAFLSKSKNEIVDIAVQNLCALIPSAKEARLLKSIVIKEKYATFSVTPGMDHFRPKSKTSIENLYLAGDWIRNDWPATMEGAVRSGYMAVEALSADLGSPQKLVQPDLPAEGLGKWLKRFS